MQIERDGNGDFILEPEDIAGRFGLSVADFRRNQTLGHVTSTVERGEDEHAGTTRLTLRIGNRIWRAILDEAGTVLSEEFHIARGAPVRR